MSYIFVFDHFSPERGRKLFYYEIQCRRKQKKKIQKFKIQNLSVLICPIFQNPVSTINREKKKTLSAFQPRLRYFFIFPLKSRFKPDAEIATNKILLIMGFVLSWLIYGSLIKEKVPSSFIGLKILFQDFFENLPRILGMLGLKSFVIQKLKVFRLEHAKRTKNGAIPCRKPTLLIDRLKSLKSLKSRQKVHQPRPNLPQIAHQNFQSKILRIKLSKICEMTSTKKIYKKKERRSSI